MLIRCIRAFKDIEAGKLRDVGEEWEATAERLAAINGAGYGKLAEAVKGEPEPEKAEEPKPEPEKAEQMPEEKTKRNTRKKASEE